MRFRLAIPEDIPDLCKLYQQYLDHQTAPYPQHSATPTVDFAMTAMQQMLLNPTWFCVVGVAGSTMDGDVVRGGRAKAFGCTFVAERPLSKPSPYAFCELVVVDERVREKGIARKLCAIMSRMAIDRGAKAIECSYRPGSMQGKIWEAAGFVPYTVTAALIEPNTGEAILRVVDLPHRDAKGKLEVAKLVPVRKEA